MGQVSKLTAEQLLSLEVLWLPAEGDRWLTKDEVPPSLSRSTLPTPPLSLTHTHTHMRRC